MKRGFTIVELLVVAAVIIVLAGIVLAMLSTSRERGQDAGMKEALRQIRNALELYHTDNGAYPEVDSLEVDLVSSGYISDLPDNLDYFYSDGDCDPFGDCFHLYAPIKEQNSPNTGRCWRDDSSGVGIRDCS